MKSSSGNVGVSSKEMRSVSCGATGDLELLTYLLLTTIHTIHIYVYNIFLVFERFFSL